MDKTKDEKYIITDFKTGRFKGYAPSDLKKLTDKLQWAIYALAVSSGLEVNVESFEYFFPSLRGAGLVRRVGSPAREEVLTLLEDLSLRYNHGAFVQAAKPGNGICTYCEFQDVCGDLNQRKQELTNKFLSPEDNLSPVFTSWTYRSSMKGAK